MLAKTRPDGLFLCGDGYQRVYARPVPLVRCGIEVRGRSTILRVNYRSTEQIRSAAMSGVANLEPDVLEGSDTESLQGYRSERAGAAVEHQRFADEGAHIRWLADQAQPGPLLVVVRHATYRDHLAQALATSGANTTVLDGPGEIGPAITVCTMHRAKGLEAPRVVVAGAEQVPAPYPGSDSGDQAWWERREQCLLYVGMTRARDWLAITSTEAR